MNHGVAHGNDSSNADTQAEPTALLAGKVVVITGGAAGIGRGIAEMFAAHGATIVVMDNNADHCEKIEAEFERRGWPLTICPADVRQTDDVDACLETVQQKHGRLDTLVNNVGDFLGIFKPLERMSDQEIDDLLSINLRHALTTSRAAIPLLKQGGQGSIINVSSIEGDRGMPWLTPYGAGKAGLAGFTKSLALELGPAGIRVNVIELETTETPQVSPANWMTAEDYERREQWLPLGRFGQPRDIAGCALFLASDLSAWVTGSTLVCDGGALAAAGWYRTAVGQWTNTPIIDRSAIPPIG